MMCKSLTRDKIPCTRRISGNSEYCWQHKPKKNDVKEESTDDTIFKNYTLLRQIGSGNFANVYLVMGENKYMAMKKVDEFKSFKNEINILNILSLPQINKGIVGIYGIQENSYLIYLEYIEGANLASCVKSNKLFDDNISYYIIKNSLEALQYIHSKDIVHRDIKMENIIFGLNTLKFIDFGFAMLINPNFIAEGTLKYLSPELLDYYFIGKNKEAINTSYSEILKKSDVYALGIVFYILINKGKEPFNYEGKTNDFPTYLISLPQIVSKSKTRYDSIINLMLAKNYKERPFVNDILTQILQF